MGEDMEEHLPKPIWECQKHYHKNTTMAFLSKKEQVYVKRDVLGVSLIASPLQLRDDMWFPRNEVPDHVVLWPLAFASKCLTGAEKCYSNIEREAIDILHGLEKFHYYCFTMTSAW